MTPKKAQLKVEKKKRERNNNKASNAVANRTAVFQNLKDEFQLNIFNVMDKMMKKLQKAMA